MEKALLPRKSPVQRRSREMVEAILDAAARLFTARGQAGMTTNAVAELAGVSVGSLYQYFPNKLALIRGVYERHRARVRAEVGGGMTITLSGLDYTSLRRLAEAVLRAHRVEPELQARFEALRHEQAFCGMFAEDGLPELRRQLEIVLRDNREQYGIKDEKLSALVLVTAVRSIVHEFVSKPGGRTDGRLEEELARLIAGYLAAWNIQV